MRVFKIFWIFEVRCESEWEAFELVKADPKRYFKSAFIPKDHTDRGWWAGVKRQVFG